MKKNVAFKIALILFPLALSSCDMLSFMTPSVRKRSNNDDAGDVDRSSSNKKSPYNPFASSNYSPNSGDYSYYDPGTTSMPGGSGGPTSQHVHTFEETWSTNASKHWHKAICGHNVKADEEYHSWSDAYDIVDATCTEYGSVKYRCEICGYTKTTRIEALGHDYPKDENGNDIIIYDVEPTCESSGYGHITCSRPGCGKQVEITVPARGHILTKDANGEDIINWIVPPTCDDLGYGTAECAVCHKIIEVSVGSYGHDFAVLDNPQPQDGYCVPRVEYCQREGCDYKMMGFNVTEVTPDSKDHLVFSTNEYGEQSARFWGRPIGNDMPLSDEGVSINQQEGECVYNKDQTGDYFEFKFNLTQAQVDLLGDCYLYCDAKPADYLSGDFWAYTGTNNDWTPGFYIDDNPDHMNADGTGKRVENYRYVLYVDGNVVDFDPNIKAPTEGASTNMTRKEYIMPYRFQFHAGTNSFRLHMAGGYRSSFYNFIFRPADVEEEPQQNRINVIQEWNYDEIEPCLTESGWSEPKVWDNGVKGIKFNKADGGFTLNPILSRAQNLRFDLLLSVRCSNKQKTGFWRQDTNEKTVVTCNGTNIIPPDYDLDFSNVLESNINDNGILSVPEWFAITDLNLVVGQNSISVTYLTGGYTYYVCGARLVEVLN